MWDLIENIWFQKPHCCCCFPACARGWFSLWDLRYIQSHAFFKCLPAHLSLWLIYYNNPILLASKSDLNWSELSCWPTVSIQSTINGILHGYLPVVSKTCPSSPPLTSHEEFEFRVEFSSSSSEYWARFSPWARLSDPLLILRRWAFKAASLSCWRSR